jgi:hypothetical protein
MSVGHVLHVICSLTILSIPAVAPAFWRANTSMQLRSTREQSEDASHAGHWWESISTLDVVMHHSWSYHGHTAAPTPNHLLNCNSLPREWRPPIRLFILTIWSDMVLPQKYDTKSARINSDFDLNRPPTAIPVSATFGWKGATTL